jgi:quinol monooxygenase YgiN
MPPFSRFVALLALALVALTFAPAIAQQQPAIVTSPPPDASPLNVVIHVDFVPRRSAEGMAALQQYAVDSRKDDGATHVEILQELAQPNHFIIVEVWRNRAAYDAHIGAAHTIAWRTTIQPLMGSPFDVRLARLAP